MIRLLAAGVSLVVVFSVAAATTGTTFGTLLGVGAAVVGLVVVLLEGV